MDDIFATLDSVAATEAFAAGFAAGLKSGDFVALNGELGAGKTAFVRGMAATLTPGVRVSSPTYALVNVYEGEDVTLCHFDMYRITGEDDLYSIGFYDYDDCVFAVEWADNVPFALPEHYYNVTITKSGENERKIKIEEIGRADDNTCN